jgi:DNA polymerase-1
MADAPYHLLIDGDILAYRASAAIEKAINWGDGFYTWHCDENEVKEAIRSELERICRLFDTDRFTIALSDSPNNFRFSILPTYKGNRANVKKPLVVRPIHEWLIEEGGAMKRDNLEGDDVMGILATWKRYRPGERKVIVSIDKDMKTIPGLVWKGDVDSTGQPNILTISAHEAHYNHMMQTLMGDTTDGYSGCPGIGKVTAAKILDKAVEDDVPLWDAVVLAYEKAKLTEDDALTQARVARILHASDFDFKTKQIRLWRP